MRTVFAIFFTSVLALVFSYGASGIETPNIDVDEERKKKLPAFGIDPKQPPKRKPPAESFREGERQVSRGGTGRKPKPVDPSELRERKSNPTPRRRKEDTAETSRTRRKPSVGPPKLHTFDVTDAEGNSLKLDTNSFPGIDMFLIVNTASGCEITSSQYRGLEKLYQDYRNKGLQVIAFPSNSFNKEPLDDEQITPFVRRKYGVTFPIFAKCNINGENSSKLFSWLKEASMRDTNVPNWAPLEKSGLEPIDVQWNFEKFLVIETFGKERVLRFSYDKTPAELRRHIDRAVRHKQKDKRKKEL